MSPGLSMLLVFFRIGLFAFGGGYAAIALILDDVVKAREWLTQADFLRLVTVAEMTPGPIAFNTATFAGFSLAGIGGAALCSLGLILPSLILMNVAFSFYRRLAHLPVIRSMMSMLRPAVTAVLIVASVSLARPALSAWPLAVIFSLCLLAWLRFKPHPLLLILAAGAAGLLL